MHEYPKRIIGAKFGLKSNVGLFGVLLSSYLSL